MDASPRCGQGLVGYEDRRVGIGPRRAPCWFKLASDVFERRLQGRLGMFVLSQSEEVVPDRSGVSTLF